MANKIYTNHTLEEYNKKYRNRKHRLLKLTKKEVEDFDKKNPTNTKGYLLKDRKWWLIGDTYYEIPKAPRYTWFRNLNGAVQVGCCLLGAGVIATAVTVPLVLMNQNKIDEGGVTITGGAEYDKEASHVKLNEDATIMLKVKKGSKVASVKSIKVGDKTIADTDYELNTISKKITIKGNAVTSLKIDIDVDVKLWTRKEYVDKLNELSAKFTTDTTQYKKEQIKNFVYLDVPQTEITNVSYRTMGTIRLFLIHTENNPNGLAITRSIITSESLYYIEEENHTVFDINDEYISYETDKDVGEGEGQAIYKKLKYNKHGYLLESVCYDIGSKKVTTNSCTFEGDPTEPVRQVVNLDWNQGEQDYEWSAKNEIKAGTKFKATLSHTSGNMPKTNKLSPYPNTIIFSLTKTTADVYIENVTYNDGTKVSDLSISDNSLLYAGSEGTNQDVIFYFTVNKDYASSNFNISANFYNS